jgi:hypothetical protein
MMIEEVGMFVSPYGEIGSSAIVNLTVKLQMQSVVCSRLIEIQWHKFCYNLNLLK